MTKFVQSALKRVTEFTKRTDEKENEYKIWLNMERKLECAVTECSPTDPALHCWRHKLMEELQAHVELPCWQLHYVYLVSAPLLLVTECLKQTIAVCRTHQCKTLRTTSFLIQLQKEGLTMALVAKQFVVDHMETTAVPEHYRFFRQYMVDTKAAFDDTYAECFLNYVDLLQRLSEHSRGGSLLQGWQREWEFFKTHAAQVPIGHRTSSATVRPWLKMVCSTMQQICDDLKSDLQGADNADRIRQSFKGARKRSWEPLVYVKQLCKDLQFCTGWHRVSEARSFGEVATTLDGLGYRLLVTENGEAPVTLDGEYMFVMRDQSTCNDSLVQLIVHSIGEEQSEQDCILAVRPQRQMPGTSLRKGSCSSDAQVRTTLTKNRDKSNPERDLMLYPPHPTWDVEISVIPAPDELIFYFFELPVDQTAGKDLAKEKQVQINRKTNTQVKVWHCC